MSLFKDSTRHGFYFYLGIYRYGDITGTGLVYAAKYKYDMTINELERSQRLQTSANALLFARWRHHIRFGSGFPYAPFNAMLTKISK